MKEQVESHALDSQVEEKQLGGALSRQTGGASLPPPPFQLNAAPVQMQSSPVGIVQRSTLSDELEQLWGQGKGPFFHRLRQLTETERADPDVATFAQTLQGDDRWLAERILEHGPEPMWPAADLALRRQHAEDNNWGTATDSVRASLGDTAQGRPVSAWYFPGQTDRRALLIAGVHGTERQGIEVAEMIRRDLEASNTAPYFTVIIVPTLFPDNAAHGRFGRRPNVAGGERYDPNRNFPAGNPSLDQSRDGGGTPRDAERRAIAPENQMLMALMERFDPERIISIHGTQNPELAGISADSPAGHATEDRELALRAARQTVDNFDAALAGAGEDGNAVRDGIEARFTRREMERRIRRRHRQGELAGRGGGGLTASEEALVDDSAIVAGNHLFLGPGNESAGWGGSTDGGVTLGGYGAARGMSIYTVEPGVNRTSDDFGAGNSEGDQLNEAQRRMELQAYADAVRTVLLGPDPSAAAGQSGSGPPAGP